MFAHHPMFIDGVPLLLKIMLVVAAVAVIAALRRRDDRAGRSADAEALTLLRETRQSLDSLGERVRNLETLLEADKRGPS
ncbi:hypothetical protein [Solidesulfovibrio sp.]|uniref:hypothetical protein n=1 Tax=Solidesulfovibrio sp. TaxID=2910990 RepID=UPI002624BC48|nr:hypothetical protein [Solidesulfovibrio sp.]